MSDEIWKAIPGYEGIYEISNLGRMRSLDRILSNGHWRKGQMIRPVLNDVKGYMYVGLHASGEVVTAQLHRLVLETFVGPCPKGMQACHNDGDPTDNRLSGLRWDTPDANYEDRERHGKLQHGEARYNAKLNKTDLERIRDLKRAGCKQNAIAAQFNVSKATVCNIFKGKSWRRVFATESRAS